VSASEAGAGERRKPTNGAAAGPSEAGPPAVAAATAWTALAILGMFYVLSSVDRQVFLLMSPAIQASLRLTDVQLSLLQGVAFSIFFGIAGLPLGWAADRFSRRWVIFFGAVVWSISAAACGLANSFATLFAPRAGVGAGEASLSPCAQSLLADLFPRQRLAFAAAVYGISVNIGGGLGTALGGLVLGALAVAGGLTLPLLGHREPWQAACLVIGLPGVLLAWFAFAIHEPPRVKLTATGADATSWGEFIAFVRTERQLLLFHFLSFPLVAMIIYTAAAWMPTYLTRVHHMKIAAIGASLGLVAATAGIAGNLTVGALSDWMTQRGIDDAPYRISVFSTLIGLPCAVAAFLANSPLLAIVLFALFSLTASSFAGTATASLNLITPAPLRGKAFSCYWLWMALMGALGPLAAAALTEHVLHDRMAVGRSVAIVAGLTMPLAAAMFALNMKGLRRVTQTQGAKQNNPDAASAPTL
jgi:MFS family permease